MPLIQLVFSLLMSTAPSTTAIVVTDVIALTQPVQEMTADERGQNESLTN